MVSRLLLLSDTHVPQRAKGLSDEVWRRVDEADVLIHAGDWNEMPIYSELLARSGRLIGVAGNNDSAELAALLPTTALETIDGVRFGVTHILADSVSREKVADALPLAADVLVFGHSHIPWDSVTPRGLRLLNPGSPTDRRRQATWTVMTAVADDGVLRDVELVAVER